MKNTILFDLDGTLLDTLTDLASSVNYALNKVGLSPKGNKEIASFLGDGYKALMQKACGGDLEKAEQSLAHFTGYYAEHLQDHTAPYDGVVEAVKTLFLKGRKMAIVSNKGDEAVKVLCKKFFAPYITEYFGVTETMPKKPAPDMLNAAMKALKSAKDDCVMVGDGEADIQMAHGAGIDIINVTWGFRTEEFLRSHGGKIFLRSTEELKDL